MSDRDQQQDPIHNEVFAQADRSEPSRPEPDLPYEAAPSEDLFADPHAFILPAIPIEPPRPVDAAPSRALASGDALIAIARDPLEPGSALPVPLNLILSDPPGAPGPGSPRTGPRPWGGDPSHLGTWDSNPDDLQSAPTPLTIEPPLFRLEPEPESRIPNFGHVFILGIIALFGFVAAALFVRVAFHFHLWGVTSLDKASTDIHYTLASMAVLYAVSFAVAFFLFPLIWHKPFFAGLQWNARSAFRHRSWLFAAAGFCFILAIADELLLPGPTNAPIDQMFSNTAAAWLLFAFGVTVAPFFEEIAYRGFLLPALCTAFDWAVSKRSHQPSPPLGPNGHPRWSLAAMIVGSLLTSFPFAAMHAEQIAHSIGPLVLLYCVSLVLCFARLATRSLAASTLVHASYNFILFSLMLWGTDGFKHLDKM